MKRNHNQAYFGLLLSWRQTQITRLCKHPLSVYKRIRDDGAYITPFDTPERRVAGKKIVNVEYHQIDWAKNFAANGV